MYYKDSLVQRHPPPQFVDEKGKGKQHSIQVELCAGSREKPYSVALLYTTPASIHAFNKKSEICARIEVVLRAEEMQSGGNQALSSSENAEESERRRRKKVNWHLAANKNGIKNTKSCRPKYRVRAHPSIESNQGTF